MPDTLLTLEQYRDAVEKVLRDFDCLDGEEVHAENLRPHWEAGLTIYQAAAEEICPDRDKPIWVWQIWNIGQ